MTSYIRTPNQLYCSFALKNFVSPAFSRGESLGDSLLTPVYSIEKAALLIGVVSFARFSLN